MPFYAKIVLTFCSTGFGYSLVLWVYGAQVVWVHIRSLSAFYLNVAIDLSVDKVLTFWLFLLLLINIL